MKNTFYKALLKYWHPFKQNKLPDKKIKKKIKKIWKNTFKELKLLKNWQKCDETLLEFERLSVFIVCIFFSE